MRVLPKRCRKNSSKTYVAKQKQMAMNVVFYDRLDFLGRTALLRNF